MPWRNQATARRQGREEIILIHFTVSSTRRTSQQVPRRKGTIAGGGNTQQPSAYAFRILFSLGWFMSRANLAFSGKELATRAWLPTFPARATP